MPMERTSMRHIREVLRLHYEHKLSNNKIGISCNISRESVRKYLKRTQELGLIWPLPADLDDEQLEAKLFPSVMKNQKILALPNFSLIHNELKKKGLTLQLLWEEHQANYPNCLKYSSFCGYYREFKSKLEPVMRQHHTAGERLFVDFSGLTVEWINPETGEIINAEIFVAVLGASNYTYVEALHSQNLQDWIGAHVRAFEFFGGVPKIVVPDNLKSGVTKAHHYDPDINLTYQAMACYYNVAVVPTRVRAPKDKAKVEVGVQGIGRRILAPLRHHTFLSVVDINTAILPLLKVYNERPFQQLEGSRLSQFMAIDKPALNPLPLMPYHYAHWQHATVALDYHIVFEKHFYSVPHHYVKKKVECRITSTTVECFYKNKRLSLHTRSFKGGYSTLKEHMPPHHAKHETNWTPDRFHQWAKTIGENTEKLIACVIASRPLPEQSFRACLGILRLGKSYSDARLEKASIRALHIGALRYQQIASILKHGLDSQPLPSERQTPFLPSIHDNVRGAEYYH